MINIVLWNSKTPGLLNGTHDYTGNYEGCLGSETDPVTMQYCVFDVGINYEGETPIPCNSSTRMKIKLCSPNEPPSPNHIIKWALCSVKSCSKSDLLVQANTLLQKSDVGRGGLSYEVSSREGACQNTSKRPIQFRTDTIIFFYLVGAIVGVVTVCTFWHWSFNRKSRDPNVEAPALVRNWSLIEQFTSLTESSSGDIQIFHCMKVLSTAATIILHEMVFLIIGPVANLSTLYQVLTEIRFLRLDLAVDTYFAIGGFLFTKNFFTSRSKSFLEHVTTRYFRIMPAYALMIFYATSVMEYTGSGPFWPSVMAVESDSCRKSWWLNMLMVNNYGAWENHCWIISWYLPCDFHFMIFGIFMCNLLKKNDKLGIAALTGLLVAALVFIATSVTNNDRIVTPPLLDDSAREYRSLGWLSQIYTMSHFRISSYVIGMLGGYASFVLSQKKMVISQRTAVIGFIFSVSVMALAIMSGLIYGADIPYNNIKAAVYGTLLRPLWTWAFMIFTFVFVFGKVPIFTKLYNMKFWLPLGKLTYSIYLVHIALIYRRIGSQIEPLIYEHSIMCTRFVVDTGLSVLFALFLYLFVERPVYGFWKIMLDGCRASKKIKHE